MNATTSTRADNRARTAKALVATALLVGGSLIAGGALAGGAQSPKQKQGKLVLNAAWKVEGGGIFNGLLYARQRGQRMGIIGILIALQAEQPYALAFSRKSCGQGSGGLLRKRIPFTGSPEGHAVVTDKAAPKLLRRAKSAVVLTPETGNEFQRCARFNGGVFVGAQGITGDFDGDGRAPAGRAPTRGDRRPEQKGKPKRKLVANAVLRPAEGSALMEEEGLFYFAERPRRQGRIIAVLIGLKAEQPYALGFSRNSCRQGSGGLLRKRIPFSGSPEGHAVITDKASPKHFITPDGNLARSIVVLAPETGGRFQGCGRLDWSTSGDADDRPIEDLA
jgi:hypothetical protein